MREILPFLVWGLFAGCSGRAFVAPEADRAPTPAARTESPPKRSLPPAPKRSLLVAELSNGDDYNCARLRNGSVSCWGANDTAQLGRDLKRQCSAVPAPVPGLNDVVSVSAGSGHACAVHRGGAVTCWGNQRFGKLGDGRALHEACPRTANHTGCSAPVSVVGIHDAVAVATGENHTCARLKSGGVACWGDNAYGQLGDGTLKGALTPVPVVGLKDVVQLVVGSEHSCTLNQAGEVYCWGLPFDRPQETQSCKIPQRTAHTPRHLRCSPSAVRLDLNEPVTSLRTDRQRVCVTQRAGGTSCWGVPDRHHDSCELTDGRVTCNRGNRWGGRGDGQTPDYCGSGVELDPLPPYVVRFPHFS